jgi:hypothetical protein
LAKENANLPAGRSGILPPGFSHRDNSIHAINSPTTLANPLEEGELQDFAEKY